MVFGFKMAEEDRLPRNLVSHTPSHLDMQWLGEWALLTRYAQKQSPWKLRQSPSTSNEIPWTYLFFPYRHHLGLNHLIILYLAFYHISKGHGQDSCLLLLQCQDLGSTEKPSLHETQGLSISSSIKTLSLRLKLPRKGSGLNHCKCYF